MDHAESKFYESFVSILEFQKKQEEEICEAYSHKRSKNITFETSLTQDIY